MEEDDASFCCTHISVTATLYWVLGSKLRAVHDVVACDNRSVHPVGVCPITPAGDGDTNSTFQLEVNKVVPGLEHAEPTVHETIMPYRFNAGCSASSSAVGDVALTDRRRREQRGYRYRNPFV